jgi:Ca2+-binding RTX toxin-like protein
MAAPFPDRSRQFRKNVDGRRQSRPGGHDTRLARAVLDALERRQLLSAISFGAPSQMPVIGGPDSAVVVTYGEGGQELVTANNNGTITILVSNGNGTFKAPMVMADGVGSGNSASIFTGDFNDGSSSSILVANPATDQVSVLIGNNNGSFAAAVVNTLPTKFYGLAVADVNGDGSDDLIASDGYGDVVTFLSNGDGHFGAPIVTATSFDNGYGHVVAGKFNGGGNFDVAVTNSANDAVSILLGNRDGTFALSNKDYVVGNDPGAIVTASFNGDDFADLAVSNYADGTISILSGNGDGTFKPPTTIAAGLNGVSTLVTADINQDGRPDLVAAADNNSKVSVILSNSEGGFFAPVLSNSSGNINGLAVADFNGDERLDVAAVSRSNYSVSLLLNANSPSAPFSAPMTTTITGLPQFVAVGDLNKDGVNDLVVADKTTSSVEVLLGNGDGTFAVQGFYSVPKYPTFVLIADINGDGNPDIVVASAGTGDVSVLLGNGNGTFQQAIVTHVNAGISYGDHSIAAADFNGDHKLDLVVADGRDGEISVLYGNGDGNFSAAQAYFPLYSNAEVSTCADAYAVAAGDLNGDSKPDIVVTDTYNNRVDVFLNSVEGFSSPNVYSVGNGPYSLALGDLTGDGHLDIVTGNEYSNNISVLLGNGAGGFGAAQNFAVGNSPTDVAIGDFTGDGIPDIATVSHAAVTSPGPVTPSFSLQNQTLSVLAGNGDGTFQLPQFIANVPGSYTVTPADLTGDGKTDLVTAGGYSGLVSTFLNTTPTATSNTVPTTVAVGNHPDAVVIARINGDTIPDLVVANYNSNTVEVLLGNGDGSFQSPLTFKVANGPTAVAVADINGDGIPDIIVASAGSDELTVLLGNGDGTFKPGIYTAIGHAIDNGPGALTVADFNGDHHLDVALADGKYGAVTILLGNGNGTFQAPTDIPIFSISSCLASVSAITSGDVNGDGHPDLILTDADYGTVDVLLGNGDGTFAPPQRYGVGLDPTAVALANVKSSNGPAAIVVANNVDGTISVLLGNANGTFAQPQTFAAGKYVTSIAVADFNGDGNPDIVESNPGTGGSPQNLVTVMLGNGDGTFQSPKKLLVGNGPAAAAAGDLNHDGQADIVTANSVDNSLSVLLSAKDSVTPVITTSNTGTGSTVVTVTATPGNDIASISVANGNVIIVVNGQTESFPIGSVSSIVVDMEGGDDSVVIGPGVPPCSVDGGPGNDTLVDNSGANNTLVGGAGDDSVSGGTGADLIHGNSGNDTLGGGGPGSLLLGNTGDDLINAGSSGTTVRGGLGDDTVSSAQGGDSLRGGAGDDVFLDFGAGSGDTLDGGVGLNFAQNNPMDMMSNIYEVFDPSTPPPSPGSSPGAAAPAAEVPPSVPAGSVTDQVSASGELLIFGTTGNDSILVTSDGTNIDITANNVSLAPLALASLTGIRVHGDAGNDTITIDQSVTLNSTLLGNGGNDSLTGGGGSNVEIGQAGNDTLTGGAATNLLIGGSRAPFSSTPAGNDVYVGGSGFSIADFSRRTDSMFLSNDGKPDSGDAGLGETATIMPSVPGIWGGTGADTIVGTQPGEFLSGGGGPDSITGGGPDDLLVGGLGKDTVTVAAEPVTLYLRDGHRDEYSGVNNPDEDILTLDNGLDVSV